ncbi:helix-turn-helix domain-containing protein [Actinocatenispora sera]|uniref:HTH cro/C1-type domain-containing protein n=1 Tax=Actinocatenispora sera TaxID=390989 RepID=A0A810L9L3_9ACTN|nr:helix-turn-helix transcriptional regulator [Actinocatenispora sera]BCJ31927.1 hypothetical protein Asera_60350 [Actinocatenispora sera]
MMLPAGFVLQPDVRAALGVGDWRSVLRAAVRVSNVSQTAIAAAAGISRAQVSRLMSGRSTEPSLRTVRGLCDALGIPRQMAGLAPAVAEPEEPATDRRAFIAGTLGALTLTTPVLELTDAPTPHVGLDDAAKLRSLATEIVQLDTTHGGDVLREAAVRAAAQADTMLQHGHYPDRVGREIQATLTELSELAGWVQYDAGQQQQARYWYQQALTHAQLIEDPRREVVVLSSLSMQATFLGRTREAVQFAQRGQKLAAGWAPPRVQALMLLREAAGWAKTGDHHEVERLLTRARTVYHPARHDDDPPWVWFLDEAEVASIEATCVADSGDHTRAETRFRAALALQRGLFPRNEVFFRVRLAEEMHAQHNTRDACTQLAELIPHLTVLSSSRLRRRAVQLIHAVHDQHTTSSADLVERARTAGLIA